MDELSKDEKDPFLVIIAAERSPFKRWHKIENLRGSIDNVMKDGNTLSDMDTLKESLAKLELFSERNNADLPMNLEVTERTSSSYNDRTCAQLRRELLKQKNLNWCLSLKIRSIHMKLNSLYAKKDQLERSVQNRMREIELQFLPGGRNQGHLTDQAPTEKEGKREERTYEDSLNKEKEKVEELKEKLVEHERTVQVSEVEKVKAELELKICKDKLNEEIENNENLYKKIKNYEANIERIKKEGEKYLDEVDELKLQLKMSRSANTQVDERNKLLQEEKGKLGQANNELKIRLQRVQACLTDFRNRERAFSNCSRKIMRIVTFLRESGKGGFTLGGKYTGMMSNTLVDTVAESLDDKMGDTLRYTLGVTVEDAQGFPLHGDTTFVQTELQLDEICASIQTLVGVKREFEGQRDELEKARSEAKATKKELERKRKNYEEVMQKMEELQMREERTVEEIATTKEKDERTIMRLRQTLHEESKLIITYKNRNEYNLMRIRRLKRRENKLFFQINKLRRYVEENKSKFERVNQVSNNKIKHIKQRNKELVTNLDDIHVQLERCVGQVNTVSKNMKIVEREKQKVTYQMNMLKSKNEQLAKELKISLKKNEAMKMKVYTLYSRMKKMKGKIKCANGRLSKVEKHHTKCNKNYKEELLRKDEYVEELQRKQKELQEELKEKEKTIKTNDECLHKLQEEIKLQEHEKDILNEEIKKKNFMIASKEEQINMLSNVESDLLKEGKVNQERLIERNKEIKSKLVQLKEIKIENVKMNDMINKLKKELINSELRCKMAYRDLEKLKKEKKIIITNLQNDLEEKEKCLQMTDQRVELLKREKEDDQSHIQHELKLLQKQMEELTTEKETYRGKVEQLNNELEQSLQKLKEGIEKNEETKKQNDNLFKQVDQYQKKINKQDEEIEALRKVHEDSERKMKEEYNHNEETLKKLFEEERKSMKIQFEALMQTERESHQKQIKEMVIQKEKEMDELSKKMQAEKERRQRDIESITEKHKEVVIKMKEEAQKEIDKMKDICEQSRKAQLLKVEKEKSLQSKIDECTSLLKEKDEEFQCAIRQYDQKLQDQNREMESLVNECEQKLKEARAAKRTCTTSNASVDASEEVSNIRSVTNLANPSKDIHLATIVQMEENLRERETKICQLEKDLLKSRRELAELAQKNRHLADGKAEADREVANLVAENQRLKEEEVRRNEEEVRRKEGSLDASPPSSPPVDSSPLLTISPHLQSDSASGDREEEPLADVEKKKKKKHKKGTFRNGCRKKEHNSEDVDTINGGNNSKEEMVEMEERKKTSDKKKKNGVRRKKGKGKNSLEDASDEDDGNSCYKEDTRGEKEEGDELLGEDAQKESMSLITINEENCYVFLKRINVKLDEIVDKLKAKEDPLLINDALNKINLAISTWNLFTDTNASTAEDPDRGSRPDGEVLLDEEAIQDGQSTQIEEAQATIPDIGEGHFSDERYEALKREVAEKVELIRQMV
eukprot:XP_002257868.1 hypothetical protein, conserved in Plasmodium species [Plasmodium knowlesi strain H]